MDCVRRQSQLTGFFLLPALEQPNNVVCQSPLLKLSGQKPVVEDWRLRSRFPGTWTEDFVFSKETPKMNDTLRKQIKLRDGYTCQKCGTYKKLEVHHIQDKQFGGNDDPDNLITLCHTCHVQHHSKVYRIYCNFRDRAMDYGMKRFRACERAFFEQFGTWADESEGDMFKNFRDEFYKTYD